MSAWSWVKGAAKDVGTFDKNMLTGQYLRDGVRYVGGKAVGAVTKPFQDAADTQKAGAAKAAGDLRGLGTQMGNFYDDRQSQFGNMRNVFDPADRSIGAMAGATPATQSNDFNTNLKTRGDKQPASVRLYYGNEGSAGPQQVRNFAGAYSAPTNTKDAYNNRLTHGYSSSGLDDRIMQRQDAPPSQFSTYATQRAAGGVAADPALKSAVSGLGDTRYASSRTDSLLGSLQNGGGDSGAMLNRILSGDTNSGRLIAQTSNPYDTMGLGETYDWTKGLTASPSNSEDFYSSSMNGTNPAYQQLKADFMKDTNRQMAARGGFVSGKAADTTSRGLSRLAGEEYSRLGALAGQADQAKLGRLGARQTSANAYDSGVLGNKNYLSGLSLGIDKMATDLSMSRDQLVAGLAEKGDISQQQAKTLMLQGATALDRSGIDRQGQVDAVMGRQGDLASHDQDAIDALTNKRADSRFAQDTHTDSLATAADQQGIAGSQLGLDAAKAASGEQSDWQRTLGTEATAADAAQTSSDRVGLDAAKQASGETQAAFDQMDKLAGRALDAGKAKAAIKEAYDMAAGGAMSSAQLSAIQTELTASGIDAQTLKAIMDTFTGVLSAGAKAYAAAHGVPA